jgi:AraC family transcriptional regulator
MFRVVKPDAVLLRSPRHVVAVRRYAPGEQHRAHRDTHPRISLLLRGGYREESGAGSIRMGPGDVLLKSHEAVHEDQFGGDGAILASLEFLADDPFNALPGTARWQRRSDGVALRHALAALEAALAGDVAGVGVAGSDLVAAVAEEDDSRRRTPPNWARQLKEELETMGLAQVDVRSRALAAGVHPVHASRLFRRCYGMSISDHASAQSVRRAWALMAEGGSSLGDIAVAAGFYDQSHMNRVFRRVIGRSPGAQRMQLAQAIG